MRRLAQGWRGRVVLGIAGTAYQGIMLRVFPILADRGAIAMHETLSPDRQLGRRTMAMRRAYARLESILPEGATLQFNPKEAYTGYFGGMYPNRQFVAFDEGCGAVFADPARTARACFHEFHRSSPPLRRRVPPTWITSTCSFFRTRIRSGPTGAVGSGRCSPWSPMISFGHFPRVGLRCSAVISGNRWEYLQAVQGHKRVGYT